MRLGGLTMSTKLKLFLYTITPFVMLFFQWIIYVLVAHNMTAEASTTRVLYLLLNCISFLIQGLMMLFISHIDYEDLINSHLLLSSIIAVILFLGTFNLLAVHYSFIPDTIDDFLISYGYLPIIWAGCYTYNAIKDLKS